MRIAQVAPLTEAIPPKLYGGTERVVHWLTEELVALGHDVTLFASGDSCTSAKLEPFWPRALRLDGSMRDPNALHMAMLEQVRRRADEFDFAALPSRLLSVLAVLAPAHAVRHDAAWPARSARASAGVRHVLVRAGGFDFERAAAAAAAGALDQDDPSRPAGAAADAAAGQAVLFRVSRPHRAGEARRHRDPHRRALRRAAEDRRQDRPRRPRLLRGRDPPADEQSRTSSTSARSTITRSRRS